MIAKGTQRTELGPLRALPTVRQARIERGMRLGLAQSSVGNTWMAGGNGTQTLRILGVGTQLAPW